MKINATGSPVFGRDGKVRPVCKASVELSALIREMGIKIGASIGVDSVSADESEASPAMIALTALDASGASVKARSWASDLIKRVEKRLAMPGQIERKQTEVNEILQKYVGSFEENEWEVPGLFDSVAFDQFPVDNNIALAFDLNQDKLMQLCVDFIISLF